MIGKSSCHSMLIPHSLLISMWVGHLPWNHFPLKYPPSPTVLAASVKSSMSEEGVTAESRKNERPFHPVRKACHMVRSLKNSLLRQM